MQSLSAESLSGFFSYQSNHVKLSKLISEDGSVSNEFLIKEEFIAMLNYYVVTSLSAKSIEAQHFRTFYCERVAVSKALDGQQDRRNWRPALREVLD